MIFCQRCGSILMPKKEGSKIVIKCACGYKSNNNDISVIREEVINKNRTVEIVDREDNLKTLPKMRADCPKCRHEEAYFWEVQTRAADEPATKFLKCVKCKHTWRDYN